MTSPTPHISAGYRNTHSHFANFAKMAKNQKSDSEEKKYSFRKFSGKKADFPNLEEDCVTFFNKVKSQYIRDCG